MAATTVHDHHASNGSVPLTAPLGAPGRVRTGGRVSRGHVVMIIAGLIGVVLSFGVLRAREGDTQVLVAAHEIRAGERVSGADFRAEPVTMRAGLLGTVVRSSERSRVTGLVVARTIAEGELVSRSNLRPRAAPHGRRAMSIPVDPARAVAGRLAAGDRVDVLFAGQRAVSIIVAEATTRLRRLMMPS